MGCVWVCGMCVGGGGVGWVGVGGVCVDVCLGVKSICLSYQHIACDK